MISSTADAVSTNPKARPIPISSALQIGADRIREEDDCQRQLRQGLECFPIGLEAEQVERLGTDQQAEGGKHHRIR